MRTGATNRRQWTSAGDARNGRQRSLALRPFVAAFSSVLAFVGAAVANAQTTPTILFPKAFVVEHQRVETAADGSTFTTEPVTDYYGGSWLVSVRPNGSRVILDFARREITEVDVRKGSYWTLTFRQMGDLRQRLQRAENPPVLKPGEGPPRTAAKARNEIEIRETSGEGDPGSRSPLGVGSIGRPGVRHLTVSSKGSVGVEVWVDPALPLGTASLDALEAFENDALGATGVREAHTTPELVAAARRSTQALPVRTRSLLRTSAEPSLGVSVWEDIPLRVESVPTLPEKLLRIGDGFRRAPSPLETMVAFAEEEAARMSRGGSK